MPRPRETAPAPAGLGAVVGAVLAGPFGAAIGGFLGAAAGTVPVTLEESVRRKLAQVQLTFESLRRASKYEIHILCKDSVGRFWPIVASIPSPAEPLQPDALDDALYDAAIRAIDAFKDAHA